MKKYPPAILLLVIMAILALGLSIHFRFHSPTEPKLGPVSMEASAYTTHTTSKSTFGGGVGYFQVNQDVPGKMGVKPLSVLLKLVSLEQSTQGIRVTSVTPCGPGVFLDGEYAYQALLITYTMPSSPPKGGKGSF